MIDPATERLHPIRTAIIAGLYADPSRPTR